ncbi:hypothetical protein FA13DRAFT_1727209, partial [Coprinellus micaceus]
PGAPETSAAKGKAKASTSTTSSENPANAQKGITRLPIELITNILANYKSIGNFTSIPDHSERNNARHTAYGAPGIKPEPEPDLLAGEPVLPRAYLERPDVLRALSQTCVAYRKVFLPLLYERLEGLERKCEGLAKREDLWQFVGCVRVLHAHTQMTTAIKNTFEKASLPTVRTVIVPGFCHEILRACPEVRSVWCTEEDGSKLIGALGKGKCTKVEEVRGCSLSDTMMKRMCRAGPSRRNLRIIEMRSKDETRLALLKSFKHLHTIDLPQWRGWQDPNPTLNPKSPHLQAAIKDVLGDIEGVAVNGAEGERGGWGEREFVQVGVE